MNDEILINVTPQETRVAVMQHGAVQELHIERGNQLGLLSNVYMGRVKRVLPGMQSAFIDIGLERAAFLHVADIWENQRNGDVAQPIEKVLYEGQNLLVQVIKDPIGSKGARLSTQISFAGRLLVYLPQETHIGVSQRIENEAERELLRNKLQQLLGENNHGGYIIRTLAETASDNEFLADITYLNKLWGKLQERTTTTPAPALLYQELNISLRVLRDFVGESTARILVDSRETYQRMAIFAQDYIASAAAKLEHYAGERPLFDLFNIEEEIEHALSRRVNLKSGGYLIIDQTEALTTVDVNTGGFVGVRNFDDTIFKTNLEAAQVIARQLRLRNLGGIIICDFIDMGNQEHRDAVLE
ncbi:MAG: Rne/Rng family ribonuclease, partial [Candidatus Nitrotoga sp.]